MFGINKKIYYSISIILVAIGVVLGVLAVLKILPLNKLVILSIVALVLLAISVFLQPYNKQMKAVNYYISKYRTPLYRELDDFETDFDKIIVKENSDGKLYIDLKKRFIIEDLVKEDASYIIIKLIKEYVMIKYCVVEDNKANFKKSNLEEFIIEFNLKDNITHR